MGVNENSKITLARSLAELELEVMQGPEWVLLLSVAVVLLAVVEEGGGNGGGCSGHLLRSEGAGPL